MEIIHIKGIDFLPQIKYGITYIFAINVISYIILKKYRTRPDGIKIKINKLLIVISSKPKTIVNFSNLFLSILKIY